MAVDALIDHRGVTLLHVAASKGKVYVVDALLSNSHHPKKYVRRYDYSGQTALHKAAKGGHVDTLKVLFHWGARPFHERDRDGRTALHYAVQAPVNAIQVIEMIIKKCGPDKGQLLFFSLFSLGDTDKNLGDLQLKDFLSEKKKNITDVRALFLIAARVGDIQIATELFDRVYERIRKHSYVERNDQPAVKDTLGREDIARGLAALLLNPSLNPPIVVGISGSWGMGKSSLMLQTHNILLTTAVQLALLPSSWWLTSEIPGVEMMHLSRRGKKKYQSIERWIQFAIMEGKTFYWIMYVNFRILMRWGKKDEDLLTEFLCNYSCTRFPQIFQVLAAMDRRDMFEADDYFPFMTRYVPQILTVTYNAWKYRNESEALAGVAVEITEGLEGLMTEEQWLSTFWRNTWKKEKKNIWIKLIFPCLLAMLLAGAFTWIVWVLLNSYNVKDAQKLKWASLPATIAIIVWNAVKSGMSFVTPVSSELMNYVKFPDHKENLGYQDKVISDIKFLKGEIGRKPYSLFSATIFMWQLFTARWIQSLLDPGSAIPRAVPPSNDNDDFRIILFVDDLGRCEESVMLQVLSAINLVLAECKINVILGMDKAMIERAILKRHGDYSATASEH